MGVFHNTGISISLLDTFPNGRGFLDDLTGKVSKWSHVSGAVGGYLTASASISGSHSYVEDWLERGLGRWVSVMSQSGVIIWRGFVDQISVSLGGLRIDRGLLTDIANRVHLVYTQIDTSTSPPTAGTKTITAVSNDTVSQALYGIWQKAYSLGEATLADAAQVQSLILQEKSSPETAKGISIGGSGDVSISLSLKGAWSWLGYIANFTTAGTINLSTRITDILGASPNAIISTNYSNIATNTWQVEGYSSDDRVAQKYLTDLLSPGDASLSRYTIGIYGNEEVYYQPIPTSMEYRYSTSDPSSQITTPGGTVVWPWEVLPARWLAITDLLVGRPVDADFRKDPRNMFIEQVNYTAPYNIQINGIKIGTLAQKVAQLGVGGASF